MKEIKENTHLGSDYLRIEIVPYNPEWPKWFEIIKVKLSEILGSLALSIDHIGSTSVPGLASKNRIDIQISVPEISDSIQTSLDRVLEPAGFTKVEFSIDHCPAGDGGSETQWKKFFLAGVNSSPQFNFNIHIRAQGAKNHQYALRFRDYLRCHSSVASGYQQLKEKLADYHRNDVEAYVGIKDHACDIIISAANDWYDRR